MIIRPELLKKIQGNYFGSIFLDNLTVANALRAVDINEPWVTKGSDRYRRNQNQYFNHKEKWDYAKNDAFRFAIELYSLAQLVEAVVLFDKIFVDYSHIHKWGLTEVDWNRKEVDLFGVANALHPLVIPVELTDDERTGLMMQATYCLETFARDGSLQLFMELLSRASIESAFLHITNGYFGTGYADPVFSYDLLGELTKVFRTYSIWELKRLVEDRKKKNDIDITNSDITAVTDNLKNISTLIPDHPPQDLLDKTLYPESDFFDKRSASEGVAQNAIAAYFYENMASYCGVSYLPHIIRSNFILYSQIVSLRGNNSTAQSIVDCLQEFRHTENKSINNFYKGAMVDMDIPFLLVMILENVTEPREILPAALEIRNSKPAMRFRQWAAETDHRIATGKMNLDSLSTEVAQIRKHFAKWTKTKANSKSEITPWSIAISLGPAAITVPIPIQLPKMSLPHRRHFIFMQRLAQISNHTPRFEVLIQKVFGEEAEAYMQEYRRIIDLFAHPPTEPLDPRLRPFAKPSTQ